MTSLKPIAAALLVGLALAAVVAAPASARVVNSPSEPEQAAIVFKTHPADSPASETPLVATVEAGDTGGFDWGSASIGAATVIGLGVVLTGAVLLYRRGRPVDQTTPAV
jgi:hypothetical protein